MVAVGKSIFIFQPCQGLARPLGEPPFGYGRPHAVHQLSVEGQIMQRIQTHTEDLVSQVEVPQVGKTGD